MDVSAVIKPSKARAVTWDYLDDGYTVYGQINNYYCGPATVKGALKYLTGKHIHSQQLLLLVEQQLVEHIWHRW